MIWELSVMQSSDAHLERALNEYNERINTLEDGPASVELVDALQKRRKVLIEPGRVPEAENHLLRQAAFSLGGDDAILRTAIEQKLDGRDGL